MKAFETNPTPHDRSQCDFQNPELIESGRDTGDKFAAQVCDTAAESAPRSQAHLYDFDLGGDVADADWSK